MFRIRTVLFLTLVAGITSQLSPDFGENLRKSLEQSLKPLENLGAQINQQVQESLKPVKLLAAKNQLKNGFRGTTIVTLYPSDRKFIVQNGVRFECTNGEITVDRTCSGELVKFQPKTKEDYCFNREGMVIINNQICIPSSSHGVSITSSNNKIECRSSDGSPVFVTTQEDFRNACKNVATSITYDYSTNEQFDNFENKLNCNGNGPTRCTLVENIDEINQNIGGVINIGGTGINNVNNFVLSASAFN